MCVLVLVRASICAYRYGLDMAIEKLAIHIYYIYYIYVYYIYNIYYIYNGE